MASRSRTRKLITPGLSRTAEILGVDGKWLKGGGSSLLVPRALLVVDRGDGQAQVLLILSIRR
jgi:hypothetical protein